MKPTPRERMHAAVDELMDAIDEVIESRGARLLTPAQAAERLGRGLSTVYDWIRTGRLIAVGEGVETLRIREADLQDCIANIPRYQPARQAVTVIGDRRASRPQSAKDVLRAS